MNITIFGSTGKTGRIATIKALEKGFQVTAYARDISKLGIVHDRL
ncbi:hypothetical protein [Salmonirosea aquatica]